MTVYYVSSAGSNTSPYDTWAKAATSLAVVTAIPVLAADTIYVSPTHSESLGSAQTWTCPTTPGLKIICANSTASAPPTGVGTGAVLATTTTFTQAMNGHAYVYGLTFQNGSSTSANNLTFGHSGSNSVGITLDTCTLYLASTNAANYIGLGSVFSGGLGGALNVNMINCVVRTSGVGQTVRLGPSNIVISGMTFHASSSVPTSIFLLGTNLASPSDVLIENSDLSGKAATNLFTCASVANASNVIVRNCKLPASIVMLTGTLLSYGSQHIRVENCDSGDTHIRLAEHQYAGVNTTSTAIYRASGSVQDDAVAYSVVMTGNANTSTYWPLKSPEGFIWNNTIGSVTLTVEFIRDSVTNLKDSEVWVEASYMGTSGFPLGTAINDRVATPIATPADQDTSSVTWTNAMTNPNKQKAVVTFTTAEAGVIFWRMCLGANTAINIDPLPVLT